MKVFKTKNRLLPEHCDYMKELRLGITLSPTLIVFVVSASKVVIARLNAEVPVW
jgi:hypothetical protein